ncbi:MAG: hypothetical protein L0287_16010 [Anaerolineae bacterium]|nr:hypothetical protein [Anaerolineae bacterium]
MIKWRVITGSGPKAKRTYQEFKDEAEARAFAGQRPVLKINMTWMVKSRGRQPPEIFVYDDYIPARDDVKARNRAQDKKLWSIRSIDTIVT